MRWNWQALLLAIALTALAVSAAPPATRPNLTTAKPIVACKLHSLAAPRQSMGEPSPVMYGRPPVDDTLTNYQRTSLGDWPMLAVAERSDPWLRLVLLTRKRPVVIDLAVLIDGKSFRDKRESWSDELVAASKQDAKPVAAKDAREKKGNKKSADGGTKPQADASQAKALTSAKSDTAKSGSAKTDVAKSDKDKSEKDKSEKNAKDKDKPAVVPGVTAQLRHKPTMRERLADYLATNKSRVDREEIRWLLAAWGAGPGVVLLDPSFSWQRSGLAPLETYLDRNGDGAFSRDEIAQADAMLKRADVDGNDVIDINEIRRLIDHPAAAPAVSGYPLVVVLDANTDWPALESIMAKVYGKQTAGAKNTKTGEPSVQVLQSRAADITLQVKLGMTDKRGAGISVLSLGPDFSKSPNSVTATDEVATLDVDGDYIEFSAAQGAADGESDSAASQIAIGAAFDGNPLLRLLDRDNDGRLTRRELQELTGLMASLDRDGNGEISAAEVPIPLRFAVTLGPHVHELLASPSPAARATKAKSTAPTAPGWFTSMDKNGDGDLSRGEFLGTTEQFKQLDTNGDGLLSVAEALKFKAGK